MMIRVVLGSSMLAQLEDRTREVRHVSLRVHTLLGSSLYVLLLESWTGPATCELGWTAGVYHFQAVLLTISIKEK